MADVINFIINGILGAFNTLATFEFLGTNMLKFSLTILIVGTAVPILFTLTRIRTVRTVGGKEKKK